MLLPRVVPFLLIQWRELCLTLLDQVESVPVVEVYAGLLRIAYEDSYALCQLRPLAGSYVLSLFAWVPEGISLWFVLRGFDEPAEPLFALSVFGTGSVVGGVSMLPGGLGATEASLAGLLIAFGYVAAVTTSATIVVRVGTLWYGTIFIAVGFRLVKLWRRTRG